MIAEDETAESADETTDSTALPQDDWAEVECPYCGECMGIYLDPETQGQMVQDCEVCCRPWELDVHRDREGRLHLQVTAS